MDDKLTVGDGEYFRDYGLGDSDQFVRSAPRVAGPGPDLPCPRCGCLQLFRIEVVIEYPLGRSRQGLGVYIGCPACPWASRMGVHLLPSSQE